MKRYVFMLGLVVVLISQFLSVPQSLAKEVQRKSIAQNQVEPPSLQTVEAKPIIKKPVKPKVKIDELTVEGVIEGENISFTLDFDVTVLADNQEIPLINGDVILQQISSPKQGYKLHYDKEKKIYYMSWARQGVYHVTATFAVRAKALGKLSESTMREAAFTIPASQVRKLKVNCDRADLEVQFPDAMRVNRQVEKGTLVVTAILGPGKPFAVRWVPRVQQMDAKLVVSSQANTITSISAAALRLDTLFVFDIAQGKLTELVFKSPKSLNVTQVRGQFISDWSMEGEGDNRVLRVLLNRAQTKQYALQVVAEQVLPKFPCEIEMPMIVPAGGIRAGGHFVVGTNSAIALQIKQTSGLSQIDSRTFPRMIMDRTNPRALPKAKAFYYSFATMPYQLKLGLADIVPSYDAVHRVVVGVKEDDLSVKAQVEMEVRDAPVRQVEIEVPDQFQVVSVTSAQIDDYRIISGQDQKPSQIHIQFKKPVLGKITLDLQMELGKGPLDVKQKVTGINVKGAKNQRGYLVVTGESGILFDAPETENLRVVNIASIDMNVPGAQYAYRFRQANWSLSFLAKRKTAGIRVENFHLISLGDRRLYGSVAISYFITGSPVDELKFIIPEQLKNVEFVGSDVRRVTHEGELYTVQLQRKVIGDYNLGMTYDQPYESGGEVLIGAARCEGVETQTGYLAVASHLNLKLHTPAKSDSSLIEIAREEVPGSYRLLATSPILKTYKYVSATKGILLTVESYQRGTLIPALVEVMNVETRLAVRKDNLTESVTTVLYKIKNTNSQYLTLQLPDKAKVWSVRQIERDGKGRRITTRLNASFDDKRGLMIPLKRLRDPNEPATIELQYGQVHGDLDWWESELVLTGPRSEIPATFANWTVTVPDDYAIRVASGGNMIADGTTVRAGGLSWILTLIGKCWADTCENILENDAVIVLAIVAVILLTIAGIFKRSILLKLIVGVLLLSVLGIGIATATSSKFSAQLPNVDHMTAIRFTQSVDVSEQSGLSVGVSTIPAWRRLASFETVVFVPIGIVAALILSLFMKRLRKVFLAGAIAAGFYLAAQFSVMTVPLGHVLTWGLPLVVMGWFMIWHVIKPLMRYRYGSPQVAMATLLIGSAMLASGCGTGTKVVVLPISDKPVLEHIDCKLAAERDSMAITYKLRVGATKPMQFALLDQSAVLLSNDTPVPNIEIERSNGKYYVQVKKKGVYEFELQFIKPLPKADVNQVRSFRLPMPMALTNQVELTVPKTGVDIEAPTAIRLEHDETEKTSLAKAILGPGDDIHFIWRPRARQTRLEETRFYSQTTSLAKFDTGLTEVFHHIQLQIAQGELKQLIIAVPDNMTVTSVNGTAIGAWRFDLANHELEVKLSRGVAGEYRLAIVTQSPVTQMPYTKEIKPLVIRNALRERNMIGLSVMPSVYMTTEGKAQSINLADFTRDAGPLLAQLKSTITSPTHAFRFSDKQDAVNVKVAQVMPELRTVEESFFTVRDDRLEYVAKKLNVDIAKAGLFSISLILPKGYDIDSLTSPLVSHWDESTENDQRVVRVHFQSKIKGMVPLRLALSKPVPNIPELLDVPRIEVVGALKHLGQIVIGSDRGVRLNVVKRQGVSELNPLDLGIRESGRQVFKLLRPKWRISLRTEVIEPMIQVESLHIARVSEGMIQHQHHLRYKLRHAGIRSLRLRVPADALGLTITGPQIARRQMIEPGLWSIELASKWFDRPYPLSVSYQSRYDRAKGDLSIQSVQALDADRQRGHVVIYTTDRVEVSPVTIGLALQPADARQISTQYGAGDLSGAVFCYASSTGDYSLTFNARRHKAATLLNADVLDASIDTVVTETGQSINRVHLKLRVGSKRYLKAQLPANGALWSLLVNGRSAEPSLIEPDNLSVFLIPLAQASAGDLPVEVEMTYVVSDQVTNWIGKRQFLGPKFDLPLNNIRWTFHLPQQFNYDDFEGTLAVNELQLHQVRIDDYDIHRYEDVVDQSKRESNKLAEQYQKTAQILARKGGKGGQYGAREMLEQARNLSFSDQALNEDINYDLYNLLRQQAKVGLVGNRSRLRRQSTAQPNGQPIVQPNVGDLGDAFTQAQAERVESSLSVADNENLNLITRRMIELQETAVGGGVQLMIQMPRRGRVLEFTRPLQVEPNSNMVVSFQASQQMTTRLPRGIFWAGGMFVGLFGLMGVLSFVGHLLERKSPVKSDELESESTNIASSQVEKIEPIETDPPLVDEEPFDDSDKMDDFEGTDDPADASNDEDEPDNGPRS